MLRLDYKCIPSKIGFETFKLPELWFPNSQIDGGRLTRQVAQLR